MTNSLRIMAAVFAIACLTRTTSVWAESIKEIMIDGVIWQYELLLEPQTVIVYGCDSDGRTTLTIPSEIEDCPVRCIASYAFQGRSSLESISIPGSVSEIQEGAFYNTGLKKITIPDSVTELGYDVFKHCRNLSEVQLGSGLTDILGETFYGCSSLTSIVIPDSVENIDDEAFYGCASMTSVVIPGSVKNIGNCAFYGCSRLASVVIPDSVTYLGGDSFADCGFSGTSVIEWVERDEYDQPTDSILYRDDVEKYFIPNGVKLPETILHEVGYSAFFPTKGDLSVIVPEGITVISRSTFGDCPGLTSITLPKTLREIDDWAFARCSKLSGIIFPEGLLSIGEYAFYGCSGLTSIVIPESVTNLGYNAFSRCGFSGTSVIENVEVSEYDPPGEVVLQEEDVVKYYIPNGVTIPEMILQKYGYRAFYPPTGALSVIIPEGVTVISSYTFENCTGLTSITLPQSLRAIEAYAFSGCSNLSDVTLPEGLLSIGSEAFSECSSLKEVTLPCSLIDFEYSWDGGVCGFPIPGTCKIVHRSAELLKEYSELSPELVQLSSVLASGKAGQVLTKGENGNYSWEDSAVSADTSVRGIDLIVGWNLVALPPVELADSTKQALRDTSKIYTYNPENQTWVEDNSLLPNHSYWIHADRDFSIRFAYKVGE